jgi:cellulose biosynthesis protein BcsQ
MKTLAFLSQKGGSGKTTMAVHTAVAAREAGAQVVVIDTDPQQSATVWSEARKADAPVVVTVAVAKLGRVYGVGARFLQDRTPSGNVSLITDMRNVRLRKKSPKTAESGDFPFKALFQNASERGKRWPAWSRHRFGLYKWNLCRLMG